MVHSTEAKSKCKASLQRKDGHGSADNGADAGHVSWRRGPTAAGSASDELEVLACACKDGGGRGYGEHPTAGNHDAARTNSDGDADEYPLLQLPRLVGFPSGFISNPATASRDGCGSEEREAAAEAEGRRGG